MQTYSVDANGLVIAATKEVMRSLKNFLLPMQTMCTKCNNKKGNTIR